MSVLWNANGYIVCRTCKARHVNVPLDAAGVPRCLNCGNDVNDKPPRGSSRLRWVLNHIANNVPADQAKQYARDALDDESVCRSTDA